MRALTLMIPIFCLVLVGCGGNSSSDSDRADSKPATAKGDGLDPCDLLSEELVRSQFEVGDAEIAPRSSVHSRYSTCLVSWPRSNDAELQAEFQEKLKEYGMAKASGQNVEMPKPPRPCEMSLTVPNKRFDDAAAAQSALDGAMDILKNGLKSRPKDPERVREINIQPVDSLGDKAAWITPNNQISVAKGRGLFHLAVNVYDDPEANRAKAIELAKIFVKEID